MIRTLQSSQILRTSLERAWDFFSDPRNLARITPPELDFTVLTDLPERIHPGMMIEYRVRPLLGLPVRWLTEITHVEPLSPLGDLVHPFLVRPQLRKIFAYREKAVNALFA